MNYWAYSMEHCLLYATLAAPNTGRDFFRTSGYLRNAGRFLLGMSTPWIRPGDHAFPYGAPALGTGTHGPSQILWKAAAVTQDAQVQALAERCRAAELDKGSAMLPYGLLWRDPALKPASLETAPTAFAFPEQGIVTARAGWDPQATAILVQVRQLSGPSRDRGAGARRGLDARPARRDGRQHGVCGGTGCPGCFRALVRGSSGEATVKLPPRPATTRGSAGPTW